MAKLGTSGSKGKVSLGTIKKGNESKSNAVIQDLAKNEKPSEKKSIKKTADNKSPKGKMNPESVQSPGPMEDERIVTKKNVVGNVNVLHSNKPSNKSNDGNLTNFPAQLKMQIPMQIPMQMQAQMQAQMQTQTQTQMQAQMQAQMQTQMQAQMQAQNHSVPSVSVGSTNAETKSNAPTNNLGTTHSIAITTQQISSIQQLPSMNPSQTNIATVPKTLAISNTTLSKNKRPSPDVTNSSMTVSKHPKVSVPATNLSGKSINSITPTGSLKKKGKINAATKEASALDNDFMKKNGLYSTPWSTSVPQGAKIYTKETTKNTAKKNMDMNVNVNSNVYKMDGINDANADRINNNNAILPGTINGMHMSHGYSGVGPGQIADPTVVKAVHDILAMLQVYGPLTHDQLEYNLPPIHPSNKLQQILDILMVTKIINIVDDSVENKGDDNQLNQSNQDTKEKINDNQLNKNDKKDYKGNEVNLDEKKDIYTNSTILNEALSQNQDPISTITVSKEMVTKPPTKQSFQKPPRYIFLNGETRAPGDAINIHDLFKSLESARQEIMDSEARIQILQEALKENYFPIDKFSELYPHPVRGDDDIRVKDMESNDNSKGTLETKKKKSGRDILLSIVDQYPEIVEDQVYATALKNFNC